MCMLLRRNRLPAPGWAGRPPSGPRSGLKQMWTVGKIRAPLALCLVKVSKTPGALAPGHWLHHKMLSSSFAVVKGPSSLNKDPSSGPLAA